MMKKKLLTIIFFFTMFCCSAHKDRVFTYNFGNVKTLIKTGFEGYGTTEKVKIAGLLSERLSLKLSYNDTIVIEFKHDCTHFFDKMIMVENGNPEDIYLINHNIEIFGTKQRESHKDINGKSAICIRIVDTDFDINKILKIVEYCILNKFENSNIKLNCKSSNHYENGEMIEINYLGMSNELLNKIIKTNDSEVLNNINKEGMLFYNDLGLKGYYKNSNYIFENQTISFQIKNLLYLTVLDNGICVFKTNKSFVYLSKNTEIIKTHKANIKVDRPYFSTHLSLFDKEKRIIENGNILLYKWNSNLGIIFSEKDNEIVRIEKN